MNKTMRWEAQERRSADMLSELTGVITRLGVVWQNEC
jgi:hypothetical protein